MLEATDEYSACFVCIELGPKPTERRTMFAARCLKNASDYFSQCRQVFPARQPATRSSMRKNASFLALQKKRSERTLIHCSKPFVRSIVSSHRCTPPGNSRLHQRALTTTISPEQNLEPAQRDQDPKSDCNQDSSTTRACWARCEPHSGDEKLPPESPL